MVETSEAAYQRVIDEFLATQGHVMVTGGAGCGKTTAALRKAAAWAAAGTGFAHSSALFLSFANATIQRVVEHSHQWFPKELTHKLSVNTYHGFAWSILRSHGYLLGAPRAMTLMTPGEVNAFVGGLPSGTDLELAHRELFLEQGAVAFDYFASYAAEILESFPLIRVAYADAFPLIVLDEFQDTVASQWRMMRALRSHTTLIALGDPEQRIYDWLPGSSATRFADFAEEVQPLSFDLAAWNWRSPEGSIVQFGRDVLAGRVNGAYDAVDLMGTQHPPLSSLKWAVLQRLQRQDDVSDTIAIITPTNQLSQRVWDYFRERQSPQLPALAIDILVDLDDAWAATVLLASLLELPDSSDSSLASACRAMILYLRTRSATLSAAAKRNIEYLEGVAAALSSGAPFKDRVLFTRVREMVEEHVRRSRTGHPYADFLTAATVATESADGDIQRAGKGTRVVSVLSRGSELETELARLWRAEGGYVDAARLVRNAIVQHQMTSSKAGNHKLVVMNVHRAKGKEFDEVVAYEESYARFVRDNEPIDRARRALNVAITRARKHATFLTPKAKPSSLLFESTAAD